VLKLPVRAATFVCKVSIITTGVFSNVSVTQIACISNEELLVYSECGMDLETLLLALLWVLCTHSMERLMVNTNKDFEIR
jgi:hypothetical protein